MPFVAYVGSTIALHLSLVLAALGLTGVARWLLRALEAHVTGSTR